MFESAVFNFGSDGINDPLISALARAYKSVLQRPIDLSARNWILAQRSG